MAGFKNLEDLVGDLGAGLVKLRAGKLEPEELTPLVDDARELCDRLVLLRFKAHEFAYEVRKKAPEGGVDEGVVDRQPVRPFRIGAAYQTSLIDAIEEVSREQAEQAAEARRNAGTPGLFDVVLESDNPMLENAPDQAPDLTVSEEPKVAVEPGPDGLSMTPEVESEGVEQSDKIEKEPETLELTEDEIAVGADDFSIVLNAESEDKKVKGKGSGPEESAPSLAEHMEQQAIGDLRTAFSLVEKYECIKVLFQDDAVLFDRVLEALDGAGDVQLALLWLHQHVPDSAAWDEEDPTVARFLDKLQRRYS